MPWNRLEELLMKSKVICDFCGKEFERNRSQLKGKKHHFCCRKCVSDYSSKEKNPEHYKELKDLTSVSRNLSELNRRLNPTRMTAETREKIRNAHLLLRQLNIDKNKTAQISS